MSSANLLALALRFGLAELVVAVFLDLAAFLVTPIFSSPEDEGSASDGALELLWLTDSAPESSM